MSLEDQRILKAIGLTVVHAEDEEIIGVTTDVLVGEEGTVIQFRIKHGWLSHEQLLPASDMVLSGDRLVASHQGIEDSSQSSVAGLIGVVVQTRGGHILGKVINVLIEPPSFHLMGLELSGGMVKDWIRGRSVVVIERADAVTIGEGGVIILPDDVDLGNTISPEGLDGEKLHTEAPTLPVRPPSGVSSINWAHVRETPFETIQQEMARVVWERHGAPRNIDGHDPWLEMVQPWAVDLKQAAEDGKTGFFDDVALLSDNQVEALRPFRLPQEETAPS